MPQGAVHERSHDELKKEDWMGEWLYQMSEDFYTPEEYREQIWEEELVHWPTGKIVGDEIPGAGDTMALWYTKTGARHPGICGWGVILRCLPEEEDLLWRPVFPSDYLKMDPIYNEEVSRLVDVIRGGMPRATMWLIRPEHADRLRGAIRSWLGGSASSQTGA